MGTEFPLGGIAGRHRRDVGGHYLPSLILARWMRGYVTGTASVDERGLATRCSSMSRGTVNGQGPYVWSVASIAASPFFNAIIGASSSVVR